MYVKYYVDNNEMYAVMNHKESCVKPIHILRKSNHVLLVFFVHLFVYSEDLVQIPFRTVIIGLKLIFVFLLYLSRYYSIKERAFTFFFIIMYSC